MVNSTENETLVLTVVESRIIGSVYLFVTLAFALPYFACLRVMFIDKTIYNSSLYQIMIHMSFADLFQLIFSGSISSIYSLIYTTDWPIFNKLFSGFAESNWFVYMYLSQVLAANRFLYVFFGVRSVQKVFDIRKTRIFIGICWFLGAVHYAVWSTPGIDFIYDANVGIFYSRGLPAVKLVQNVDLIIDCVHTFVQIIWYTAIYLRIKTKVSNISSDISIVRQNKADQKIMLQAFLLCMSDVVIIVLWQLIGRFVANGYKAMKSLAIFTNLSWFFCTGSNAVIYLIFNSQIRRGVKNMLNGSKFNTAKKGLDGTVMKVETSEKQITRKTTSTL